MIVLPYQPEQPYGELPKRQHVLFITSSKINRLTRAPRNKHVFRRAAGRVDVLNL